MTQHLVDTRPKLGNCVRCNAWVFTALVGGAWAGVDTAPLSADALRALILGGGRPFRMVQLAGRAQALRVASLGDVERGAPLLGEHSCGGHPMDARAFREAPQVPRCPPVSATGPQGPRSASAEAHRGTQSPRAANAATRPRSRPRRCDACRNFIKAHEPYWGIECGTYVWALHDQCPE